MILGPKYTAPNTPFFLGVPDLKKIWRSDPAVKGFRTFWQLQAANMRTNKEAGPRDDAESFMSAREQHADDDSDGACVPLDRPSLHRLRRHASDATTGQCCVSMHAARARATPSTVTRDSGRTCMAFGCGACMPRVHRRWQRRGG